MATVTQIDKIGTMAADIAMRGAADYLTQHAISPSDRQFSQLTDAIIRHAHEAIGPALSDAAEAEAIGMRKVAEATFTASMRIAGIKAAKEVAADWRNATCNTLYAVMAGGAL